MQGLSAYIEEIRKLCAAAGVKTLFAFGSVTTDRFNAASDVDLVVDIDDHDPISYSERYFDLKFQLENLLKRPVDLIESRAIRNPYIKQEIEKTKVLVYGK